MRRVLIGMAAIGTGFALLGSFTGIAAASTYTVSGTSDGIGPCNGSNVCPSLRAAVNAANADPGSTIQLGANPYTLAGFDTVELRITANMTITGAGSGSTAIQQTDSNHRVINVFGSTNVTISGLTVSGGTLTGPSGIDGTSGGSGLPVNGGGIANGGNLILDHVIVSGNTLTGGRGGNGSAGGGGAGGNATAAGIYNSGTLTLNSSAVTGNTATGGAGGSGTAGGGGAGAQAIGGISNTFGSLTVQNSTINANTATGGVGGAGNGGGNAGGFGGPANGGIESDNSVLTITGSTVSGNSAAGGLGGGGSGGANGGHGGLFVNGGGMGVFSSTGTVNVSSSTFSGNSATGGNGGNGASGGHGGAAAGGGIYTGAPTVVVNTTITGNTASGGTGGSPGGVNDTGSGGGIQDQGGATPSVRLASVTLASNTATGGQGGNLFGSNLQAQNTIIAGGSAAGTTNCSLVSMTDDGHNLESSTPSQCGFSAGSQDLIGVDPLLQGLASNGGPTQTRALGASSPALAAGDTCTDPLNSGNPLSVDQRGLPRSGICDIGAFQAQRPANTGAPQASGNPALGEQLSCSQGSWSGDPPLSFAFQWVQDGTVIAGATSSTYTVQAGDAGHQLSCRVTASNIYGESSQVSNSLAVPSGGGGGSGPSNTFTIGKLKGTVLSVDVASAGLVAVAETPRGREAAASAAAKLLKRSRASGGPGIVKVRLRLTAAAKHILKAKGKLKVRAKVTFTPTGGTPNSRATVLRFKRLR